MRRELLVTLSRGVGGAVIGVGTLLLFLAWRIGETGEFAPVGADLGAFAIVMLFVGVVLLLLTLTRGRGAAVAFALVMSLLVVTAPVAASHGLVVASIHTTDSDFNAGTLTNMTVSGSGDSASVTLENTSAFIDGFEDGDITEYTGDNGPYNVQSTTVINGSQSLHHNSDSNWHNIYDVDSFQNVSQGDTINTSFRFNGSAPAAHDHVAGAFWGVQSEVSDGGFTGADGYYWTVQDLGNDDDHDLRLAKWDGGSRTVLKDKEIGGAVPKDENWTVETRWNDSGGMRVELYEPSGTLNTTVQGTDTTFTEGGIGWIGQGQSTNAHTIYDDYVIEGGVLTPGTYISANHSVTDSEQGFVNLTEVTNATVTVTWESNDGSGWSTLNETTGITTAANHTFTWAVESNDTVRVNVTAFNQSTNGVPAFTMADEGVQFSAVEHTVNNSSATPTGDLTTATPTLKIDINDSDFPLAQGDTVTVEFFVDGSSEGTDTLTSNGTASLTLSALSGGDHTWHVVATDDYGHSVTSQTVDISTPGNVTFRREQPNHPIIDDREINGTIYGETDGDQFVENFTTTDGNVSLTGVPTDEHLVVVATTEGFHQREVILTDIFNQTDMYLLNTSKSSATVTFDIQDSTGEFSKADTEFIIERSINRSLFDSGGFTQEAIAGDRLGAVTEYTATLKQDQRYTIVMRNPDGDKRTLGAQVAKQNGTVPIRIASVELQANETQGFNWTARTINDSGNEFVEFVYVDEQDLTTSVDLVIYEYGNASNEIHNQTHTGTFGTLKVTEQLVGDDANKTWAVQFDATRSGETESGTVVVGQRTQPLGVPLDDEWKYRVALLTLVVVGFIVGGGVSPEAGGIAIVCAAGMWLYIGWMPPEVTGVAVGFGALTAVGFAVGKRGGEPVQ